LRFQLPTFFGVVFDALLRESWTCRSRSITQEEAVEAFRKCALDASTNTLIKVRSSEEECPYPALCQNLFHACAFPKA